MRPPSSGSRSTAASTGSGSARAAYFCNERCPKGVDPRDAIAKLGAEAIKEGIDRDMGAKHAKWFIRSTETTGWLRETELVPKTQGIVSSVKQMKFAMSLIKHNKAGLAFPPHVAANVGEARALHKLVQRAGPQGFARARAGRARAREARARVQTAATATPYGPGSFPRPYLPGEGNDGGGRGRREPDRPRRIEARVAYYKGCLASLSAKELDTSTQALAPRVGLELIELESVTCCGAGDIHEAEPDYYLHLNARILAYAEAAGADTLLTVCNVCTLNLRQANFMLKGDAEPARPRQREPQVGRRAAVQRRASTCGTCSGRSPRARATRS